jgi:type I restriction enzyme S subunit
MSRIEELIAGLCPEGVTKALLGRVALVGTGSSDKKDSTLSGSYPLYVRSKEVLRSETFEFDEVAIVIPGEGGIGEIFHFVSGPYALHQRAYRIAPFEPGLDPKFLYYFFASKFKEHIVSKAVSATVSSIRKPMIESFLVSIPPLPVQREIVSILDKFTQLEAELEAELEARRRQYEHYRDKLLTFKELDAE